MGNIKGALQFLNDLARVGIDDAADRGRWSIASPLSLIWSGSAEDPIIAATEIPPHLLERRETMTEVGNWPAIFLQIQFNLRAKSGRILCMVMSAPERHESHAVPISKTWGTW